MTKPIVLIAEELSPATIDALGPDFEIRHVDGASREALLPALADVDAVLIRSATKMDPEAIAAEATRVPLDPEAAATIGTGESPFGDGRASARIVGLVRRRLAPSKSRAIRA